MDDWKSYGILFVLGCAISTPTQARAEDLCAEVTGLY